MPLIDSTFRPPWWLRNGHLQTILPVIWPRRIRLACTPERLELADGDFVDLEWVRAGAERLAILSHGLESDSRAAYIRGLAAALLAAGWDVLAWSFRGCGGSPNRLPRSYHSGETGDLSAVIGHAAGAYRRIGLAGFSLGGNVTLKYLGEAPPHPAVCAAVAISAPVDLAASAGALDRQLGNRLYLRRFLWTLIAKIEAKARLFPGQIDAAGVRRIRSFQEFDDRYTARLHGFRDAADYWAQASSRQYLSRIGVPALLLNARDDPFLPPACFPVAEAQVSARFFLEAPAHGGHVGFVEGLPPGTRPNWLERRIVDFLESAPL
jgi:predicted alpha/beta-fold hydrolase